MSTIKKTTNHSEIRQCYQVMAELRPHLDEQTFVEQVQQQMETQQYRLAYVEADGEVVAVAGYRFVEMLAWGKAMYVDDLVTKSTQRNKGYGEKLFDWLVEHARQAGCVQFHLDSGVQRFGAHRFYLRKRMDIVAHHFAMGVKNVDAQR